MKDKTVKEIKYYIRNELSSIYSTNEIDNFSFMIFQYLQNYSKIQFHLNDNEKVDNKIIKKIIGITSRLKKYVPIQYIFESTEFYDLKIEVSSAVLIPRPETEELVDRILKREKRIGLEVIDIGTGSGCIAIALAKNLIDANVDAIDISEDALKIAKNNAILNDANVNFFILDICNSHSMNRDKKYDIVVSNPPYVKKSEKTKMYKNVLNHEPEIALFVNDNDPLLFYKHIILFAKKNLKDNGKIYVEINEALGKETRSLFQNNGFNSVEVEKDINGKDRFVIAIMNYK